MNDHYIDIHTHSFYSGTDTTILLNVFPGETDKLSLDVYKSVGLHPWHIHNTWEDHISRIEEIVDTGNIIAVGETGLDKVIETDFALQNTIFKRHLKIAEDHHKPIVIHCVRSYNEMLWYRKKSDQSLPWIFHWFNADLRTAHELVRKNCYLSFGHMLFNEKSKAFRIFTDIPPEHIFFETDDAGYTIQEVYEKASSIRKIRVSDMKTVIMDNFARCFQL